MPSLLDSLGGNDKKVQDWSKFRIGGLTTKTIEFSAISKDTFCPFQVSPRSDAGVFFGGGGEWRRGKYFSMAFQGSLHSAVEFDAGVGEGDCLLCVLALLCWML